MLYYSINTAKYSISYVLYYSINTVKYCIPYVCRDVWQDVHPSHLTAYAVWGDCVPAAYGMKPRACVCVCVCMGRLIQDTVGLQCAQSYILGSSGQRAVCWAIAWLSTIKIFSILCWFVLFWPLFWMLTTLFSEQRIFLWMVQWEQSGRVRWEADIHQFALEEEELWWLQVHIPWSCLTGNSNKHIEAHEKSGMEPKGDKHSQILYYYCTALYYTDYDPINHLHVKASPMGYHRNIMIAITFGA